MKITKEKIRDLVVEQISEAMGYQLPPMRPESIDKDIPYISGAIRDAVFDALEELSFTALQAEDFRARLDMDPDFTSGGQETADPVGKAVEDYLRKLDLMGGKPKPRSK